MQVQFSGKFTFRLPADKSTEDLGADLYFKTGAGCFGFEETLDNGKKGGDGFLMVPNRHDDAFREVLRAAGAQEDSYEANTPAEDATLENACSIPDGNA